jgi:hypothetical protein
MGLQINIKAGADASLSIASASGQIQHVITDQEVSAFGITDGALKNAIGAYFGQNPDDAFLHSPTPWGDLYKNYQWQQVITTLVVESATITGFSSVPTIISSKNFINSINDPITCTAEITQEVSNTSDSNWSTSDSVTVEQSVSYEIEGIGGETKLSYTHGWGQGGGTSQSVTLGTSSGVEFPLAPGETAIAHLMATIGKINVRVVYKAYLDGTAAINYGDTFKDHHFWGLDIGSVMAAVGISNVKEITEDISINLYSESTIKVEKLNGQVLMIHPLAVVGKQMAELV